MKWQDISCLARMGCVLGIAGSLMSCDTAERRALRDLNRAGVEPTGGSVLSAVGNGDEHLIRLLIAAGVHLERKDDAGRTPLRIAIDAGDGAIAGMLVDGGADVNAEASDGCAPLGRAVERMDATFIGKLLEAGARLDARTAGGEPVLSWAIRNHRAELVSLMMTRSPDPHQVDRDGNPLLHIAMQAKRRDLVEGLLKRGADPGQVNARGESTLHVAIRNGWWDVIPDLVKSGADPNLPGPAGVTPLGQAVKNANVKLIAVLLRSGADPNYVHPSSAEAASESSPFELAFLHSDRRVFETFMERRIRFTTPKMDSWLQAALDQNDIPLARMLLSRGARADFRGTDGWLPIESAVMRGQGTVVKLLSDYGSPEGRAFHLAAVNGDGRMAKLLLSLGMNPDVVHPPYIDRPLSVAIRCGHDRVAALLIQYGAATDFRLPEGQTPLHLAVARGCPETVRSLLADGADANATFEVPAKADFIRQVRPGVMRWSLKADRNVSLLMMAADSGNTEVTRHLLNAGAKKNVWTRVSRLWPINFASRRSDVKMMRLILGQDPQREERHIVVNLREQRARVFDSEGNEIFTTKVSTGRKGYATPTGEFVITNKHRDWTSTIYHASMPYFQRLSCSDFGLHAGNVPGYPASHGCIRVPAGNAAKLFAMTQAGDRVRIEP